MMNFTAGTWKERGMSKWRDHLRGRNEREQAVVFNFYELPWIMEFLKRWTVFKFIPVCPTFLMDVDADDTDNSDTTCMGLRSGQKRRRSSINMQRRLSSVLQF
jgi:hypothetical protein